MQPQHAGGQGAEVPLQKASSERSHPLVLSAGRLQNRRLAFGIGGRGGYLRCKRRYLDAWRIERHGAACSQVGGRGRVPRFVSCCWFARVLGVPARPAAPPAARQPRAAARRCARAPSCAGTRGWGALLRRAHLEARSLKFEFEFAPRKAEKAGYALRYGTVHSGSRLRGMLRRVSRDSLSLSCRVSTSRPARWRWAKCRELWLSAADAGSGITFGRVSASHGWTVDCRQRRGRSHET